MRALVAILLAGAALLPAAGAAGPLYADATLAEYFRLQWEAMPGARGPALTGYVENLSNLPFDRIQLLVESLDASGAVTGRLDTRVLGLLPAHQRGCFTTPVPAAPSYRVTIASFDWANCRD
ncbi:MAG TPA: hypothetical protein VGD07_13925 [Methylomirabilota bacterium]|jgi:hypothetical protein